ncbi:zinc finger protein ZAT11-like [Malania oleifera]|uniref:zinc finger protein ZAT11-like n=1 Tax=Malania oleifera TaxID=397392 RepID=UPI0025ADD1C6|nr:zinc finger protein ZAT11-like [Malania oleifera]
MKRERQDGARESLDMANCLMLLSRVGQSQSASQLSGRVFECKTCNRQFSSFQALGGHRASHKKPRIFADDLGHPPSSPGKPKTHECSICGLEFAIGQALGGHMRRHRATTVGEGLGSPQQMAPAVMKKSSSKRVLCLDLNLTPLENDLKFRSGRSAAAYAPPAIHCYL